MKQVTTAIAVLAAALFLTACGKKEEPAAAPEAAPAAMPEAAPADTVPADTVPADTAPAPADSSNDAPQSGGDQVKP
jgi:predicted small lipoprotein YifL